MAFTVKQINQVLINSTNQILSDEVMKEIARIGTSDMPQVFKNAEKKMIERMCAGDNDRSKKALDAHERGEPFILTIKN